MTLIGGGNDFGRCGEWFSLTGLTGLTGLFSGGGDLNLVSKNFADGVALRATTNPPARRIACRRLAPSIPRSASRLRLDRREISGATLRVPPCRRTRKAAFAAHETSRTHGTLFRGSARTGSLWDFVCREGGFRVPARRRSPNGRRGRPPPARRLVLRSASREGGSLKPGGGKSPPDRQRRSFVAPGFVVARSAAPSTNNLEEPNL